MSKYDQSILHEQQVTAHAKPAEKADHIDGGTPGQGASAEDLGGPLTKPAPGTEPSVGKAASAKAKKLSNRVTQGASSPDAMPHLQGSAPGQTGMKEEEEYDEDVLSEAEECDDEDEKKEKKEKGEEKDESPIKKMKKEDIEVDVEDHVSALIEGEDLSEEFKNKASVIFEAAVRDKVFEVLQSVDQYYEERLVEEVAAMAELFEEKIDTHLDYVTEQWVAENQLAIDQGIRNELTEEFIEGLKRLFQESYIEMPQERYDVLSDMAEVIDEMETKLNEQIEINAELNKSVKEYIKNGIISEASANLATTQSEKLRALAESVEFESEENYREKINTLKESYFPSARIKSSFEELTENISSQENLEGTMATYAAAIRRWS